MRRLFWKSQVKVALSLCAFAVLGAQNQALAASCTATEFFRDSINLTAALINPPDTATGDVDATGCNIGVYYSPGARGRVDHANIHGANYFGVVNNGAQVDITNSSISNIGETPLNGDQHGVAIYFAFGSNAQGNIEGNYIWNYQKGGIVVNGPSAVAKIRHNTVIGQGPVNYIAQNGIQAGYGASTTIEQNLVYGNSYTGAGLASSGGILLIGGDCYGGAATINTDVKQNVGLGNDVGIWFSNLDASCNAVATPTRNAAEDNTLVNNAVNNTTGNGPSQGYQAGIADQGDMDVLRDNVICGPGYTPPGTAAAALFAVDVSATNNPVVRNNVNCVGRPHDDDHRDGAHPWSMKPSHHR
jgi:Right handed beta helix region